VIDGSCKSSMLSSIAHVLHNDYFFHDFQFVLDDDLLMVFAADTLLLCVEVVPHLRLYKHRYQIMKVDSDFDSIVVGAAALLFAYRGGL
jgi:hypothetical protein